MKKKKETGGQSPVSLYRNSEMVSLSEHQIHLTEYLSQNQILSEVAPKKFIEKEHPNNARIRNYYFPSDR